MEQCIPETHLSGSLKRTVAAQWKTTLTFSAKTLWSSLLRFNSGCVRSLFTAMIFSAKPGCSSCSLSKSWGRGDGTVAVQWEPSAVKRCELAVRVPLRSFQRCDSSSHRDVEEAGGPGAPPRCCLIVSQLHVQTSLQKMQHPAMAAACSIQHLTRSRCCTTATQLLHVWTKPGPLTADHIIKVFSVLLFGRLVAISNYKPLGRYEDMGKSSYHWCKKKHWCTSDWGFIKWQLAAIYVQYSGRKFSDTLRIFTQSLYYCLQLFVRFFCLKRLCLLLIRGNKYL